MTSGWREYSTSSASAGGQEEQPWLVKSSTTARGGSAKAGCRRAARPRAAKVSVKRDAMMAAMEHEFRLKGNSRYLERQRIVRKSGPGFSLNDALFKEWSIGSDPKSGVHFWVRCFRAKRSIGSMQHEEHATSLAQTHLSLRERSTRVSAAGEGLQVYPERAVPLTLASLDLSPPGRGSPPGTFIAR